jgi:hypothetical protein
VDPGHGNVVLREQLEAGVLVAKLGDAALGLGSRAPEVDGEDLALALEFQEPGRSPARLAFARDDAPAQLLLDVVEGASPGIGEAAAIEAHAAKSGWRGSGMQQGGGDRGRNGGPWGWVLEHGRARSDAGPSTGSSP